MTKQAEVEHFHPETQGHTPGPWRIGESRTGEANAWAADAPEYERAIFSAQDQVKIAVCESWYGEAEEAESEANARLIASAPALLEALEKIANWSIADGSHAFGARLQDVARQAIALARRA